MTTLADRRAELTTAMATGGVTISDAPGRVAPPVGYIFGDGSDLHGVLTGRVAMSFRVTLVAGKPDAPAASDALGELTLKALSVLRSMKGWKLGEVRPDRVITIAGGDYLACDVTTLTQVDI